VVLTVHDAVACVAPKEEAEEAMAYVMEVHAVCAVMGAGHSIELRGRDWRELWRLLEDNTARHTKGTPCLRYSCGRKL
jgi:hypothetical protein